MNILKTIDEILSYYMKSSRCGHTNLMIEGIRFNKKLIVAANEQSRRMIMSDYSLFPEEITTLSSIEHYSLRGKQIPLAFDNHAIYTLLYTARDRIKELEAENKRLEDTKFHMTIKYEEKPKEKKIVAFRRVSDNELFTLNDDGLTYSMELEKRQYPKSVHMHWSKDTLLFWSKDNDTLLSSKKPDLLPKFIPIYED